MCITRGYQSHAKTGQQGHSEVCPCSCSIDSMGDTLEAVLEQLPNSRPEVADEIQALQAIFGDEAIALLHDAKTLQPNQTCVDASRSETALKRVRQTATASEDNSAELRRRRGFLHRLYALQLP